MEESIERIREEEQAEKSMRLAQEELQRGEAKLDGKVEKRNWIKSQKPTNNEKGKIVVEFQILKEPVINFIVIIYEIVVSFTKIIVGICKFSM